MIKQKVKVRPMTENDISDVLDIDREVVGEKRALTYRNPPETYYIGGTLGASLVAEIGNKVVGFVLCRVTEPGPDSAVRRATIEYIGVSTEAQRQGVGKAMLTELLERSRENKVEQLTIITNPHDVMLRQFLTSLGFMIEDHIEYRINLVEGMSKR